MRINIAVCDDENQTLQYIGKLAAEWAEQRKIDTVSRLFRSAEEFKLSLKEGERFDILLLDIQMGGQSGLDLAKELRTANEKLMIVFITALPDFIHEGYDVSALHYLLKPVKEDKLFSVLDKAVKILLTGGNEIFLPTGSGTLRLSTGDIIYIESFDHFLEIKTIKEKLTLKMPLYELEGKLGGSFIRCHRSYLVNLRHIKKITRTEVYLDGGGMIPLSRRLYSDVNKAMIKYFTEGKNL